MLRALQVLSCALALALPAATASKTAQRDSLPQGPFPTSTDIGTAQRGNTTYSATPGSYEIMGGGDDVWGTADAFRFAWTRISGDASLAANLHIDAPVSYRISKGMLMFRASLEPGSPYADVAMHADGHITLQYRLVPGGETKDVTLHENNVPRLRITRRGDRFTVYAGTGKTETANPLSITVLMQGPIYVGLGACSHNTVALQGVTFSQITLQTSPH